MNRLNSLNRINRLNGPPKQGGVSWSAYWTTPIKYYVDAVDGLDTNDGLTPATAWKTLTKVNATSFAAGDGIAFKGGQTFAGVLTVPTSGSEGSLITFGAYGNGDMPIIAESTGASAIAIASKNYIRLQTLDIRNNNGNAGHRGVYVSGTCTGIQMYRCNVYSSGYGVLSGAALSNSSFTYVSVTGGATTGIYFFGAASSNVTVSNCTTTNGGGIQLTSMSNPTANNNVVSGFTSGYNGLGIQSCSGVLTLNENRIYSGTPANGGIYLLNNTFTSGTCDRNILSDITGGPVVISNTYDISVNNTIVYNCTAYGFVCNAASYNITLNGCISYNNGGDGFNTVNAHDITFKYCRSSHCGNKASQAAGDGFSSHLNDYNIYHLYCIADYNTASGFAMVHNSTGFIYGCIAYKNAGNWTSEGGLDQIRAGYWFNIDGVNPTTGDTWKIRNCIGVENYPREVWITTQDIDYNQYIALDESKFASLSGWASISWDTYHASYEAHSVYADPLIKSDSELYPTTPLAIGEALDAAFDDGMDITTNWGSITETPTIVTKQQGATWQLGAYVQ